MRMLLAGAMALLLLRSGTAMAAVSDSCRLFVTAVLPGMLPYMVLSLMLVSRCRGTLSPGLLILMGWCGGSPAGARLMTAAPGLTRREQVRVAVSAATMSPMFLVGTCGQWLGGGWTGPVLLLSVLLGGGIAGVLAGMCHGAGQGTPGGEAPPPEPLPFGRAVEQSARTLLMVCGTMAMWRMFAALAQEAWPSAALPLMTLLEVTAGVKGIAGLPLPLALRTALAAGATGFGGMAILMQNRAVLQQAGKPPLPLPAQLGWQAVHGALSFLLALGGMLLAGQS